MSKIQVKNNLRLKRLLEEIDVFANPDSWEVNDSCTEVKWIADTNFHPVVSGDLIRSLVAEILELKETSPVSKVNVNLKDI